MNEKDRISLQWLDALKRKSIKNITHAKFVAKYAESHRKLDDCIFILKGIQIETRQYFFIRILMCLYEPFVGPHYVQIGTNEPFWVHSLTAFRREFFGLTDKLSFERSTFLCLEDGEIIRLKFVRPYVTISQLQWEESLSLKIYKTPFHHFTINKKEYEKHVNELELRKQISFTTNASVRMRVRTHLVNTLQQIFCSYMRDHCVLPHIATEWFHADIQHALSTCNILYTHLHKTQQTVSLSLSSPKYSYAQVVPSLSPFMSIPDQSFSALLRDEHKQGLPSYIAKRKREEANELPQNMCGQLLKKMTPDQLVCGAIPLLQDTYP